MSRPSARCPMPRPEHPRPDLHRGMRCGVDWANLNGLWEFEFDPEDAGLDGGWQESGQREFTRRIMVPFPWESHLAWGTQAQAGNNNWFNPTAWLDPDAVTLDNYRELPRHTVGWYRRAIEVPPALRDSRVFLNIGAVDWRARVWVNGIEVGEATSGYTPLDFDITDALTGDGDEVTIRVEDPQDHSRQPIGKQTDNWYTRTSGIWQSVWLEPRGRTHLTEILAHPSFADERVTFDAGVTAADASDLRLAVEVRTARGRIAAYEEVEVSEQRATLPLDLSRAIPWTPDCPHMYRVTATLLDGDATVDSVQTGFGLRDVGVCELDEDGPAYICINDEPVYLRGALDQSFHPEGVYSYPSDAALREDLLLAARAGFNFLRVHIKAEDPRFYYWADRLGMLLMSDLPNVGYDAWCEESRGNWERTAEAIMRRDFNHPSIFSWCLFNETWGLGGREYADMPDHHAWVRECYERAKDLDPTRLIEDNSPCLYDHVVTDINSWHFYINDYEKAREHIENVLANTHPGSEFNFVGGNTQGDEPLMNSEYGGIGARMGDVDVSWCFLFLTNEIRRHEKICGYVYTELQDIEWEHNGIYDYDRSPKEFGYDVALLQGERFIGLDCPPGQTVNPGEEIRIPVFLRPSRERWPSECLRWRATFVNALGSERTLVEDAALSELVSDSASIEVTMPAEPGLVRVEAMIRDGAGRVEAMNLCWLESVGDCGEALALPLVQCRAEFPDEVERGEVEGVVQLLSGEGSGRVEWDLELPADTGTTSAMTFVAELSSRRPGAPQTSVDRWQSEVAVEVDGVECALILLENQPADSRGALSHMHGFQGRYGELVRVAIPAGALTGERVTIGLTCGPALDGGGGLAVYGARAGRYPCGPMLVPARR